MVMLKNEEFKFREADELISALQNDVEKIISELREEDKKERRTEVPVNFSNLPYRYLKYQTSIDKVEIVDDGLVFCRGGQRYICNIVDDFIKERELELKVRASIDEIANEVYRNTVIQNIKGIGMVR